MKAYLTIGLDDFDVSNDLFEITPEQMEKLRITIYTALQCMEDMYESGQSEIVKKHIQFLKEPD